MLKAIKFFDNLLEKISRWGLILSLFIILLLSVMAILLRWFGISFLWIEPLVRHIVFLSAFLGGSLATSKGVHIRVDLFTKLIESSSSGILKWAHENLVTLFCLVTSSLLTLASWNFFLIEKEFGAPSFLDIHSSFLVGIIPFGMMLVTLRFFNRFILGLIGRGTA